jgi:hypothetical protein
MDRQPPDAPEVSTGAKGLVEVDNHTAPATEAQRQ